MDESSTQQTAPSPDRPAVTMTESAYLDQQAAAAKRAIAGAFSDLKLDLGKGVDPRQWVKKHPWMTLASVAVAGFAAAAATVPSKEEQALKKLEAIERAIRGQRTEPTNGHARDTEHHETAPSGVMAMLFREMVGAVKPLVIAVLTSRLNPQPSPPPQDEPPTPSEQDV